MKIGIFIGGLSTGGAERVVCNLSNYLSKNNEVTIITLNSLKSSYPLEKRVKHIALEKENFNESFIIRNIKRVMNFKKFIKNNNQDVYITFLPITNFIILLFRKFIKCPIIPSVRVDPNVEYSSVLFKILMKWLYPKADGFIFQTKEAKEYFNGIIKVDSEIIPNPINEDFIKRSFEGIRKKEIVTVGRLVPQKNHRLLIEAFSKIDIKFSDYKLIIYGDGVLRSELQEYIDSLGLTDKVLLKGNSLNIKDDIYESELFVLTSNYEGMPNSLMEAMALGIPVISTDCNGGGARFLINNNINGILVPIKDCGSLVNSINYILGNDEIRKKLGKESNKISVELNPKIIHKKWENYIRKVVKNHKETLKFDK